MNQYFVKNAFFDRFVLARLTQNLSSYARKNIYCLSSSACIVFFCLNLSQKEGSIQFAACKWLVHFLTKDFIPGPEHSTKLQRHSAYGGGQILDCRLLRCNAIFSVGQALEFLSVFRSYVCLRSISNWAFSSLWHIFDEKVGVAINLISYFYSVLPSEGRNLNRTSFFWQVLRYD